MSECKHGKCECNIVEAKNIDRNDPATKWLDTSPKIPEITEENFETYFKDVRKHPKPEPGEVMASWRATADFVDGWIKREVLKYLLTNNIGAEMALKVMQKLMGTVEDDAIRVCKEMLTDYKKGIHYNNKTGLDAILEKPYRMVVELFYWTQLEYVPDDIHWTVVKVFDLTRPEGKEEFDKTQLEVVE